MRNLNSRTLALIGSLLALNVGLFVFNNLPIVPVRDAALPKKVIEKTRHSAQEAREMARTARAEARAARREARAAARKTRSATKSDKLMGLDQLSHLRNMDRLGKLELKISPAPPKVAVFPQTPHGKLGSPAEGDTCTRRVTLHQYLRDHMM